MLLSRSTTCRSASSRHGTSTASTPPWRPKGKPARRFGESTTSSPVLSPRRSVTACSQSTSRRTLTLSRFARSPPDRPPPANWRRSSTRPTRPSRPFWFSQPRLVHGVVSSARCAGGTSTSTPGPWPSRHPLPRQPLVDQRHDL